MLLGPDGLHHGPGWQPPVSFLDDVRKLAARVEAARPALPVVRLRSRAESARWLASALDHRT